MIAITCFMAGMVLGVLFYGGLWITLRRIITTHHPVVLTLGSLVARTGLTLAGFVVVTNGSWQNAVACLAGFVVARVVISRWLRVCT